MKEPLPPSGRELSKPGGHTSFRLKQAGMKAGRGNAEQCQRKQWRDYSTGQRQAQRKNPAQKHRADLANCALESLQSKSVVFANCILTFGGGYN